jgi:hypothetical protein
MAGWSESRLRGLNRPARFSGSPWARGVIRPSAGQYIWRRIDRNSRGQSCAGNRPFYNSALMGASPSSAQNTFNRASISLWSIAVSHSEIAARAEVTVMASAALANRFASARSGSRAFFFRYAQEMTVSVFSFCAVFSRPSTTYCFSPGTAALYSLFAFTSWTTWSIISPQRRRGLDLA